MVQILFYAKKVTKRININHLKMRQSTKLQYLHKCWNGGHRSKYCARFGQPGIWTPDLLHIRQVR